MGNRVDRWVDAVADVSVSLWMGVWVGKWVEMQVNNLVPLSVSIDVDDMCVFSYCYIWFSVC